MMVSMAKLSPEKIKKLKNYFEKREDVSMAFLFGSYAKGTATKRSDADVGVYFDPVRFASTEEVENKRKEVWSDIDTLLSQETDVIALNEAPAPIAFEILRAGIPLSMKNPSLYTERLMAVSSEAIDFMADAKDYGAIFFRSASLSSIDELRLTRRLTFLVRELKEASRFKPLTQTEYVDEENQEHRDKRRLVERWIENIVNCSIDIAKVLLASHKIRLPDTYQDMLLGLYRHLKFDEAVAKKIAHFVDLRNIVAHQYLDIRFQQIRKFIDESEPLYQKLAEFARSFLGK